MEAPAVPGGVAEIPADGVYRSTATGERRFLRRGAQVPIEHPGEAWEPVPADAEPGDEG